MESGRFPKQVMSWTPDGIRQPERPKETWQKTIQRDKLNKGLEDDVEDMAQRRDDWRKFIADLWVTRPEED